MESHLDEPEFAILIDAYRKSLVRRYSVENLARYPEFSGLPRATVDKLIRYFLELLYPEYEIRLELDNAFTSLAGFVKSPRKFLGVIGNMGYAVVKFGKHLFAGIKAGIAALSSYLTAHKFENTLYSYAKPLIQKKIDISQEDHFNSLIAKIPYEEATEFRHDIINLFKTLANRELLKKIILINDHVIEKMKENPKVYNPSEVKGIEMGLDIMKKGRELFDELTDQEITLIIRGIDIIEKDFYENSLRIEEMNRAK
ncbi:MAG: hypothetical protein H7A25_01830 [Leptospiraceae bacterium]|nr:hypothetical protein [Leptospiraceae bacterium]MCP5498615.1 hypothetical protein [Leptospiraceae bacterium]